jgi:ATP-binding protein involved in chromosome partitioning
MGIDFLGELPLEIRVREGADAGLPVVIGHPEGAESKILMEIAAKIAGRISAENMRVRLPVLNAAGG